MNVLEICRGPYASQGSYSSYDITRCSEPARPGSDYCAQCLKLAQHGFAQKVSFAESEVATAKDKLERALIDRNLFLRKQGLL